MNGIVKGIDVLLLLKEPKVMGAILAFLQSGDIVEILPGSLENHFTKVKIEGIEGYVRAKFIQIWPEGGNK